MVIGAGNVGLQISLPLTILSQSIVVGLMRIATFKPCVVAVIQGRWSKTGRQQSNTVDYFPHDAEPGQTLFILKSQFGNDGYAFWFQLLEVLCKAENHFYDCNNELAWQYLLARTSVKEETGTEIMKILAKLGKIDPELWQKKIIWCEKLVFNLEDVYKKRGRKPPQRPCLVDNNNKTATEKPIIVPEIPIYIPEIPQSKVKESKVNNKGTHTQKERKDSIVAEIFAEMRGYLGYPDKVSQDPIPSYGKEGQAIKRMLTRGFTREEILACWKGKVSQRGGEFISMIWVNEDIGQTGKQKRRLRELSTEEEIAASIKEVAS